MKAIILAAGLGTRLKPLTDTMPKALVKVWGKPMLQKWLESLYVNGFREVAVNVHHFGEQVIEFIDSLQMAEMTIHISDERDRLLDTGGGIRKAAKLFKDNDEPVLVCNVDIMTNADLKWQYEYHLKSGNDATLLVSQRESSRYLVFETEKYMLRGWTNKKTGETKPEGFSYDLESYVEAAFSGIHVIGPEMLRYMDEHYPEKFSIIDFYIDVCRKFNIQAKIQEGSSILDVGKLEVLKRINAV